MPSNKREELFFGLMMVSGMASVMFIYNLYMADSLRTISVWSILLNFALVYVVAFLIESFIVGPIAKKMAFKLPFDKSKKVYVILALSTCMVSGMVICMSMYGLITLLISNNLEGSIVKNYLMLIVQNFVVAYPLQLLLVGPISRWVLVKFIKNSAVPKMDYV